MTALSPYGPVRDHREDPVRNGEQGGQPNEPFISLLELIREIYKVLLLPLYSQIKSGSLKNVLI